MFALPLLCLLIGCQQTAVPDPVPDYISYTPAYVDVVTSKVDQAAAGVTKVEAAVKENTEVLLKLKELVERTPTAGGVEPPESPSTPESSPPPAPPIWETDRPYVQYWGATWCSPCRTLRPKLDKVLPELGLEIAGDFDTDTASIDDVNKSKITVRPTVLLCVHGKEIDRFEGCMSEKEIRQWFRDRLNQE